MKGNTGSSTNSNPKTAGAEAAKKAKAGLDSVNMAYVYASCAYDLDAMLAGIAEERARNRQYILYRRNYTGRICNRR